MNRKPNGDAALHNMTTVGTENVTGPEEPKDLGDYEIQGEIARGGMGVIYKARQVSLNRTVAIKMILAGQLASPEAVARFKIEAEAAAGLDHPNILPIHEIGERQGQHYFSMKFVDGGSLGSRMAELGANREGAIGALAEVCRAVHFAHQRGILHRDLKPTNVLFDSDGNPYVADFGVAKMFDGDSSITQTGAIVGTPSYMAPEQARGEKHLTTAVDVYSLGAILYEMLTGRPPFCAETVCKTIRQVIEAEPEHPQKRNPGADRNLSVIAMKCLEKDPLRRYDSAAGLAEDLTAVREGRSISARPTKTFERCIRRMGRNPAWTAAVTTAVASLIFITAISLWQAAEVKEAARRAEANGADARAALAHEIEARREVEEGKRAFGAEVIRLSIATQFAADAAFADNRPERARGLLSGVPEHLRGFEWSYRLRRFEGSSTTLNGHKNEIIGVAISPDGTRITSASSDGAVRVWDPASGVERASLTGPWSAPSCVAFGSDGERIAFGSREGIARVYHLGGCGEVLELRGHTGSLACAAFSSDGKFIATGSNDNTARLWDAGDGREIAVFGGHSRKVVGVAFSPDCSLLASASFDGTVRIWDLKSLTERATFRGHSHWVTCVAFSPDGTRIASGSCDRTAKIWNAATGENLSTLRGHSDAVISVVYSPDGRRIATGSFDKTVRFWDADTGNLQSTSIGHSAEVTSVAFSANGRCAISGSGDGSVKVWNLAGNDRLAIKGHGSAVNSLAFSDDGKLLASASEDRTLKVWDSRTGIERAAFDWNSGTGKGSTIVGEGGRIAIGSNGGAVKILNIGADSERATIRVSLRAVHSWAFNANGSRPTTGTGDYSIRVWDVATSTETAAPNGHTDRVTGMALSPDGYRIAIGSRDGTVKIRDSVTGAEIAALKGHTTRVTGLAFSPDGGRIVSGSLDRTGVLWDAEGGSRLLTFRGHSDPISSVAYSPDGSRIASGSWGGSVKVWDTVTGSELLGLEGRTAAVTSLAFSPRGDLLASGSADGTVVIWGAVASANCIGDPFGNAATRQRPGPISIPKIDE